MRRIILFFTLTAQAAQAPDTIFRAKWVEFLNTWQDFIRISYGCPLEVKRLDDELCIPGNATVDMKLFSKARKQAKNIFELQDAK